MKLYLTLNRRRLLAAALAAVLIGVIAGVFVRVNAAGIDGSTAQARLAFAAQVGCRTDGAVCTERRALIPQEFSEVYAAYNRLQMQAGFDLSAYKGCQITLYTYSPVVFPDCEGETQLNLMVYNGRIIGGDISETALDGQMLPLLIREGE